MRTSEVFAPGGRQAAVMEFRWMSTATGVICSLTVGPPCADQAAPGVGGSPSLHRGGYRPFHNNLSLEGPVALGGMPVGLDTAKERIFPPSPAEAA